MDRLEIHPTTKTPYVLLDPAGKIIFRGRSIPEDVAVFYEKVMIWIQRYCNEPSAFTEIEIEMEYLNSGTSKYLLKILKVIKEMQYNEFNLKINWIYEEGDDDILERGEYYASILDLQINFTEKE
ncbi:MAG: DUF1987 domain-containing protein [Bacteroidales bacterium]